MLPNSYKYKIKTEQLHEGPKAFREKLKQETSIEMNIRHLFFRKDNRNKRNAKEIPQDGPNVKKISFLSIMTCFTVSLTFQILATHKYNRVACSPLLALI